MNPVLTFGAIFGTLLWKFNGTFCWAMNCHKFMQGHISLFLGIEIKDEFPAWRNDRPLLTFNGKETSETFDSAKRKGETITLRRRMVNSIVLRVVQVVSIIHNPCLKSIPFLYFSRDHLRSTMQWGSLRVQFGHHLRSGDHHYSFHRHLRSLNERVANQSSPNNSNLVASTRRLFLSR